jgi:hypothetical protein
MWDTLIPHVAAHPSEEQGFQAQLQAQRATKSPVSRQKGFLRLAFDAFAGAVGFTFIGVLLAIDCFLYIIIKPKNLS